MIVSDIHPADAPLDRVDYRRTDHEWLAARLDDPTTRVLPFFRLRPLSNVSTVPPSLAWQPVVAVRAALEAGATPILLGVDDAGTAFFALAVDVLADDPDDKPLGDLGKYLDARSAGLQMRAADVALLSQGKSLIEWHARHGFCANCGAPTRPVEAGYARSCGNCGAKHFPHSDPVVIMNIVDAADPDRILLGRKAGFPSGSYSCLAGFVEPGETLEQAVCREAFEEAGVRVRGVHYVSSQPWPFPSNLMVGCHAQAITTELTVDTTELEDARWVSRAEVAAGMANCLGQNDPEGFKVPPPVTIAHHLIKAWLDGA